MIDGGAFEALMLPYRAGNTQGAPRGLPHS